MKSKKYTAGQLLRPWGGAIGYALSQMFISGWAMPIIVGCIWLCASFTIGEALCASATDTRQQRYQRMKKAQR
jgi:hypothetical protein